MNSQPNDPTDTSNSFIEELQSSTAGISQLGTDTLKVAEGFFGLVFLEARLAFQTLPKLVEVLLVQVMFYVCVWVSMSVCIMWAIFTWTDSVFLGLIAMTLTQIAGIFTCQRLIKIYKHRLSLPHTQEQLKALREHLHETIKSHTTAN